jgi:hypothetical protein
MINLEVDFFKYIESNKNTSPPMSNLVKVLVKWINSQVMFTCHLHPSTKAGWTHNLKENA